ncbi:helix-turn-helix domain-containing protein [Pseudobutyrivibrio sp. LB2011]|uniref:helix-turn-helix domain-containing protein n=1 Tax=Pseudobutyrivibrio sp. LB2011 TaxID=1408312 RepID=UPI0012DDF0CF|nr:helix-turn-helix domain-containing protein [Pseudobutyrivibrio sp. LB2011]
MITKEKIKAFTNLIDEEIITPVEFAKIIDVLSNTAADTDVQATNEGFTIENIKRVVSDYFNLTTEQIESNNRSSLVVRARQIAIYICKKYTDSYYQAIGQAFGGRDHSVIIHAVNRVEDELAKDEQTNTLVLNIVERIKNNENNSADDKRA